jgi:hypothetical protein
MAAACGMAFAATQEVVVEAVDANGALVSEVVCDIVNRGGAWRVVTPAVAQITPSGDWMQVKCAKGLDLAGFATSIDTNGLAPRRTSAGFARELAGAPTPAKVRVVLRDMTGAAPKPGAPTQTVQGAPMLPAAVPAFVMKPVAAPDAAPVARAAAPPAVEAAVPAVVVAAPVIPQAAARAMIVAAAVAIPAPEPIAADIRPPVPVTPVAAVATRPPRDFYDARAVPFISGEGRAAYTNFLAYPMPRAFAISKAGGWGFGVRGSDPGKLALDNCERRAGPCELYAVDRRVVWAGSNP